MTYAPALRHDNFGHFARPDQKFEVKIEGITSADAAVKASR